MRVLLYSDLHLELRRTSIGSDFAVPAAARDVDVVVLAGDIHTKLGGVDFARRAFGETPVVYVPGNHEYYGAAVPHHTNKLRAAAAGANVHVLDCDVVVIDGVRFVGATLWADFCIFGSDRRNEIGEVARARLNDFARIRTSPPQTPSWSRLTPRAMWRLHREARAFLQDTLATPFAGPTVVVTHHAPALACVAEPFRSDPLCGAYVTDQSDLLDGRAALWLHGHTHFAVDKNIGGTRVVSNPRGYPDEPVDGFDAACVLVIDDAGVRRV